MKRIIILSVLTLCAAMVAGTVWAQDTQTILDFTGFVYEDNNSPGEVGFPPSNPGDILAAVGFIESVSQPLYWSPDEYQYTIYISDLVSDGEVDIGYGTFYITYSGGSVDIVAQRYNDAGYTMPEYGVEPPNATAPSTFMDGDIYLHGEFSSFYMVYYPTLHVGNFEGVIAWTIHPNIGELINDYGTIFSGTVDPIAAPVPDGYDLEMDGHVMYYHAVPTENSTWGQVKNLYR